MACSTPQAESQGILHHTVGFWPWPLPVAANLQICKEAKGQGQEVQAKGQSHKGSCPLLPLPF